MGTSKFQKAGSAHAASALLTYNEAASFVARLSDPANWPVINGRSIPPVAGGAPTIEEIENRVAEVRSRIAEIDDENAGRRMSEAAKHEWNELGKELMEKEELLEELHARADYVREVAQEGNGSPRRESGAHFNVPRDRAKGSNIWDMGAVRMHATSPEEELSMLRDNAMRALDIGSFPHPEADQARCKEHIEKLIERFGDSDSASEPLNDLVRRIISTGNPVYKRAFGKTIAGRALTGEEQRALSLTGASGGFAVPYTLDPTIIPTSNSTVNPMRALARTETIAGSNEWRGVTAGAITASRDPELSEVSDDAPTLAQPTLTVTKVAAFVPFSIEVGQDWGSLQAEMARLLQDAKDDEEATSFVTGDGTGQNPQGVVVGTTGTVAAGTAAFAVAHLYALEEALPPRFRPRAQFIGNRSQYNRVRQFDTAGGASLWVYLRDGLNNQVPTPGNTGAQLLGYPANEASQMSSALTAATKILVFGDFRYYLIVDRIGMDVELIPHLFGATNQRPTGQRGLYAHWRNFGKVLSANAFRALVTT